MIPVSELTLRRDLKSGKLSFDSDAKGRKQIDVSELTGVYGSLTSENGVGAAVAESAEPVKNDRQNVPMNGNDSEKILALLEEQGRKKKLVWGL